MFVPPRGLPGVDGSRDAARELSGSPYRRSYRLARRLTAGAPTTFDAVRGVERYLERNMRYDERPPERQFPLESFLFRDKIGYCQHFSGAMALLLRMSGIPTRVVSGFSPGVRDAENRDEYRIRDLDAHSWVEVYFAGIGWVTFDPTPPVAPAQSQAAGFDPLSGAERDAGSANSADSPAPRGDRPGDQAAQAGGGEGGSGLRTAAHRPGRPGGRRRGVRGWQAAARGKEPRPRDGSRGPRPRAGARAAAAGPPARPGRDPDHGRAHAPRGGQAGRRAVRRPPARPPLRGGRSRPARQRPRAGRCAATWAAGACAAGCGPGARFRPAARGFRTA